MFLNDNHVSFVLGVRRFLVITSPRVSWVGLQHTSVYPGSLCNSSRPIENEHEPLTRPSLETFYTATEVYLSEIRTFLKNVTMPITMVAFVTHILDLASSSLRDNVVGRIAATFRVGFQGKEVPETSPYPRSTLFSHVRHYPVSSRIVLTFKSSLEFSCILANKTF